MEISFSALSAWNLGLFRWTQLISWKKGSHWALPPQLGLCFYSRQAWKDHLTLIRSGKWEQSQNSFGRLEKSLAVADQKRSKGESAKLSFRSQLSLSSASSSSLCPFHQLVLNMGSGPMSPASWVPNPDKAFEGGWRARKQQEVLNAESLFHTNAAGTQKS